MSENYAIIIQFLLPLMTFYRSGAQKSNVYKRDVFVTSWNSTIAHSNRNVTTAGLRHHTNGNQSKRLHSKTATTRTATLSRITTRTATLLWSKRPHCFGQNGHISWVATKTATLFWSKGPHSFWSKRPQSASPVKRADLASKTASLHLVKTATLSSIILC